MASRWPIFGKMEICKTILVALENIIRSPLVISLQQFGGHIFDPQIQRYIAAKNSYEEYYKPTAKAGRWAFLVIFFPVFVLWRAHAWETGWKEEQITSGTISYQDRKSPIDAFRP